jgi:serine/threonine protein kinase
MSTRSQSRKNTSLYEVRSCSKGSKQYVHYRIGSMLGKGGFATVYEIVKDQAHETQAVKIISKKDKNGRLDHHLEQKVRMSLSSC